MIEKLPDRPERRACLRVSAKGSVTVAADDLVLRARIGNLSTGGLLAKTRVTAASRFLGRVVRVELRLDSPKAEWLGLTARVVRIEASAMAVIFPTVSPEYARMLDHLTTAAFGNQRLLSVVLIDERADRRAQMAEAFRASGCTVVDVATPLEAIVALGELPFEPALIAVGDSIPDAAAGHMRTFVEREHPRAKLVTIGDNVDEPFGIAHWLSSADPNDDLVRRVLDVLGQPRRRH